MTTTNTIDIKVWNANVVKRGRCPVCGARLERAGSSNLYRCDGQRTNSCRWQVSV